MRWRAPAKHTLGGRARQSPAGDVRLPAATIPGNSLPLLRSRAQPLQVALASDGLETHRRLGGAVFRWLSRPEHQHICAGPGSWNRCLLGRWQGTTAPVRAWPSSLQLRPEESLLPPVECATALVGVGTRAGSAARSGSFKGSTGVSGADALLVTPRPTSIRAQPATKNTERLVLNSSNSLKNVPHSATCIMAPLPRKSGVFISTSP
mmetsp:Transcript_56014/g.149910  ORF Transcript_56014/g.149910 Transcript_56014/m.149910 type:complete len:207 (-) Transcript_56014:709-1329(-)